MGPVSAASRIVSGLLSVAAEFEANLLRTCCYLCSGCGCIVAVGTELGLWAMS